MTMPDTPARQKRRAPLWMKIVLLLSLSLNLIIFGAMAARMWYGPGAMHKRGMSMPGAMLTDARRFIRKMPRERRADFRAFYIERRDLIRQSRRLVANARRGLARVIARETFDQKAFDKALKELKDTEAKSHDLVMTIRADLIRAFTPEERRTYARRLLKRQKWRMHNR